MPGPKPYTDIGGGGPLPPHGEDFFDRIVNVHWPKRVGLPTGGVFVAVDSYGTIFYIRVGSAGFGPSMVDGSLTWNRVGTFIDPGSGYEMYFTGSAFGLVEGKTPVFVIVGGAGNTLSLGHIYASHDGANWSHVYTQEQNPSDGARGANVFAVTWDGSSFWAGGHQSVNRTDISGGGGDPNAWEYDILLQSSNGFSWSEVDRHQIFFASSVGNRPPDDYTTGLLDPHCSSMVKDINYGNSVPGGVYGYDEATKILIAPAEISGIGYFFGSGASGASSTLDIQYLGGLSKNITPVPGLSNVSAVAVAGGIWMAAGGPVTSNGPGEAAILVPSATEAGGYSWRQIGAPGLTFVTLCGGQV